MELGFPWTKKALFFFKKNGPLPSQVDKAFAANQFRKKYTSGDLETVRNNINQANSEEL
jgi:hypothetical protein